MSFWWFIAHKETTRNGGRDRDVNKFRFTKNTHTHWQFWHLILELDSPWSFSFLQSNHSWNLYSTCSLTRNKFISMTHRNFFFLLFLCNRIVDMNRHTFWLRRPRRQFYLHHLIFQTVASILNEFKVKICY